MAQVTTSATAKFPAFPAPADDTSFDGSVRRGSILLVEDRDDVREGLVQLLELHGFVVVEAPDGEQALALLARDPRDFALVLLDLMLPGAVGGQDVRACQLADAQLSRIPTVIVSACEADRQSREQLQPAAWLEKPFRFESLLRVVRQFVRPEVQVHR
jgi:DNA-binding response OmpR family regulator